MRRPRVAFQGEAGAFGEMAVLSFFGQDVEPVGLPTLDDVFRGLASGSVDHAVAAIENSQIGPITRTYDLLRQHDVFLVGETEVAVDQCLLALPGESLASIRRVHSHPAALEQCEAFIDRIGAEAVAHHDTAGSARMIVEKGLRGEGAIASRRAAEVYGLEVLADRVQTIPDNRTRFVVLAREAAPRRPGPQKTSLVMVTDHRPGALHQALGAFATRDVNLLRLESRPSRGRPWEYVFYLDVEGHRDDPPVRDALADLARITGMLKVLGSFPRHE